MAKSQDKDAIIEAALAMREEPNPDLLGLFEKYSNRMQ